MTFLKKPGGICSRNWGARKGGRAESRRLVQNAGSYFVWRNYEDGNIFVRKMTIYMQSGREWQVLSVLRQVVCGLLGRRWGQQTKSYTLILGGMQYDLIRDEKR
jgi:hypothetical protein